MTPGSNPLPPLAAPETASVPADRPLSVSLDTFSQACARALSSPVIVTDIGDGALLVEPLHFHRVIARRGRKVVSKSHHHGGFNG